MLRYQKPVLVSYGSISVGYQSPTNQTADCSCDCASPGDCARVGSFVQMCNSSTAATCVANCGTCSEFGCA